MAELPAPTPATVTRLFTHLSATQNRTRRHPRLSASQLGDPCDRKLWDAFRWLFPPEFFDGRKLSIFRTGEVWEWRLVWMLNEAGVRVQALDPATNQQFRVTFAGGHGSGRTDGKATNVPEAPKTEHVLEIKSHNDRSFKGLLKDGVRVAKPAHYAQVQAYMHLQGLTRALYLAVNKNTDDLFADRIDYDAAEAMRLMARADMLVALDRRPACSCPSWAIKGGWGCAVEPVMPARTCRSCLHVTAHLDGDARWSCSRHKTDALDLAEQEAGCPQHLFNPTVVPGEQVDFDEARERVTYRLATGETWVDGAAS